MKLYDDIIITKDRAIAKSYAKINLTLDVLKKLENGYHEVRMIMQSLNLFDLVIVDKEPSKIKISTNNKSIPTNSKNIAHKAAVAFFEATGIQGGAKILIHKNIPVAAGLAGGSGNAAAVLCALNLLYNANLSEEKLLEIGLSLGADVPYCILGGTYLAEGIGERLTKLPDFTGYTVVLAKPDINISTAAIYNKIDSTGDLIHPDTKAVSSAIERNDVNGVAMGLSNVMESVTKEDCPEIVKIREDMMSLGAIGSAMSGSGPTVFGIFPDNASAKQACDYFSKKYDEVFLTHTI